MNVPSPAPRASHLVGIAGTGMSALAEALLDAGEAITGSDRFLDAAEPVPALAALQAQNVALFPQDGSGVTSETARVIASVAVEEDNPDLAAARRLGIPVERRADALSDLLSRKRLVAVGGTCGKSTTTAILGHLLSCAGLSPSVVNGAPCLNWAGPARTGAVLRGDGPLCIAEVDESNRQILAFHPDAALVLNASADHFPLDETNEIFDRFLSQVRGPTIDARGEPPLEGAVEGDWSVSFPFEGETLSIPLPGLHHAQDALLACRMALALGVPRDGFAAALASFRGLARRMELVGTRRDGVHVVDDYAHNTEKIRATLRALRERSARLCAVWRPHGYGPLRAMHADLAAMFRAELRPTDLLLLLPVFDAGGTADRSFRSEDFADELDLLGVPVECAASPEAAGRVAASWVRPGDLIVTLGARDPALPRLARSLCGA